MGSHFVPKKLSLLILSILVVQGTVSASLTLEQYDDGDTELFIDKDISDVTLSGTATCNDDANLTLNPPELNERNIQINDGKFQKELDSSFSYGNYQLNHSCKNSENINFDINSIQVKDYSYIEDLIYHQERQEINISIDFKGSNFDPSKFSLRQKEFDDTSVEGIKLEDGGKEFLSYSFYVPDSQQVDESLTPSWYISHESGIELEVRGDSSFELRQPWDISVKKNYVQDSISFKELKDNSGSIMVIDGAYKGESWDFIEEDFKLEVFDEEDNIVYDQEYVKLNRVDSGYELYEDDLPELPIGEYNFKITVTENENIRIGDFNVLNFISFQGTVNNADGNPVETDFELKREEKLWRKFTTIEGKYSEQVLPGFYNMSLMFEDDVKIDFTDVHFNKTGSKRIMYDRIPSSNLQDIEGVTVVKASAALFGYGFEKGEMTIGYNFGDVQAEEAQIIRCNNWPMSTNRECSGSWDMMNKSKVNIDPTQPEVSFPVKPETHQGNEFLMKGYALVKNTDLEINFQMDESRVPIEEQVEVSGAVETAGGKSVENVNVVIEFLDGNGEVVSSRSSRSNKNGAFAVSMNAPSSEDVYDIRIKADKDPYNSHEIRRIGVIDTYVEKDITVDGPDQVELQPGRSNQIEYLVVNSGQKDLKDLRFRISGLNNEWYEISKSSWKSISAGSSQRVTVNVSIPDDYFDGQNIENKKFDAEARAVHSDGEINDLRTTVATITNEYKFNDNSDSSENEEKSSGSLIPENVTGNFVQNTSSLNMFLGFIIVFVMILATAIKKSSENDSRAGRRVNSVRGDSSSNSRVSEVKKGGERPHIIDEEQKNDSKADLIEENDEEGNSSDDKVDEFAQALDRKESSDDTNENESKVENVCSVCGEEFDSKSAAEMHEKAIHN